MQSKGAIRFLAIALAIVCLYQLSFTIVANYWNNKIQTEAAGDPVKEKALLDSMATAPAYNLLVTIYLGGLHNDLLNLFGLQSWTHPPAVPRRSRRSQISSRPGACNRPWHL